MIRAITIPASSEQPCELIEIEGNLEEFQKLVGGLIEPVTTMSLTIYINEEGKLLRLPVNTRASWFLYWLLQEVIQDFIVGDAVVVGPPDAEGKTTSVDEDLYEWFRGL